MNLLLSHIRDERGAILIMMAFLMIIFIGFAAFAIDFGHIQVVRNELNNAADAGALAGARFLYNSAGTDVNINANQIAYDAATANTSENALVEVNWTSGNTGEVQRGHWSFSTRTFTPNDSTAAIDLWNVSTDELDANLNFINAIRVVTRRQSIPAASFLARVVGWNSFQLSAEAVAYIGFAGTLGPGELDQPIAICADSILVDGEYSCNIGRMINSGQDIANNETGGWTSFNQDDPCTGGTNAQEVRSLVCGGGNPETINFGKDMATNGGDIQSAFNQLIQCWQGATGKAKPWNMTLPVVNCPGNNMGTCEEVRGAVNLNVIWITDAGEDPTFSNVPTQMDGLPAQGVSAWSNNDPSGQIRWNDFVQHFQLKNVDGSPAPYSKKSIYFLPDCTPHDPKGVSNGENFGILAEIPLLVK